MENNVVDRQILEILETPDALVGRFYKSWLVDQVLKLVEMETLFHELKELRRAKY